MTDDLFQQQMMRAKKSDGGGDGANEKETMQHVMDASSFAIARGVKMLLPVNVANFGEVSILQPLESKEGWANKTIPNLMESLNSRGGALAQIAHALVKNGVITDHTTGTGGGPPVEAPPNGFVPSGSPTASGDRGGFDRE